MTISDDWIEWSVGQLAAVCDHDILEVLYNDNTKGTGQAKTILYGQGNEAIRAYRVVIPAKQPKVNGGKLPGNHYYLVSVSKPIAPDVQPYVAECADIIEALNMTFNEGECFKAIWRLAASRQGRVKPGSAGMQYDADKVGHYGVRVAEHTRSRSWFDVATAAVRESCTEVVMAARDALVVLEDLDEAEMARLRGRADVAIEALRSALSRVQS